MELLILKFFLQLSYQIVDSMIWLGIRDMINDFRKKKLKLRPVTYLSGSQGSASDVPHGYIWSPHLVPKPKGFCFRPSSHILCNVAGILGPRLGFTTKKRMTEAPVKFAGYRTVFKVNSDTLMRHWGLVSLEWRVIAYFNKEVIAFYLYSAHRAIQSQFETSELCVRIEKAIHGFREAPGMNTSTMMVEKSFKVFWQCFKDGEYTLFFPDISLFLKSS
ncbi:hypothetical protein HHK36_013006 [Tetracentron sinense]|uniref:Uncharacterized protein n=1 Tax=Tetracentron sinense TaxID=13715 RepID=A0A834Z5R0_TETSI|nr:hypothetical protein HHK36_013006 [Tetracentron sinense]